MRYWHTQDVIAISCIWSIYSCVSGSTDWSIGSFPRFMAAAWLPSRLRHSWPSLDSHQSIKHATHSLAPPNTHSLLNKVDASLVLCKVLDLGVPSHYAGRSGCKCADAAPNCFVMWHFGSKETTACDEWVWICCSLHHKLWAKVTPQIPAQANNVHAKTAWGRVHKICSLDIL